ncbi:patatin-like phospholipase family protein [Rubrolithibacter danxiaensis]|uniref:patatin-like phospholipase family protein n=1 Tax=Rubrolithibacter danxiaensis TaxID=3390805 RepID=UPI003BF802E9
MGKFPKHTEGSTVVNSFSVTLKEGAVDCEIAEYWHPLHITSVSCENKEKRIITRTVGISKTDQTNFTSSIKGTLGIKNLLALESELKSSRNITITTQNSVTDSLEKEFAAPPCKEKNIAVYQLVRQYEFIVKKPKRFGIFKERIKKVIVKDYLDVYDDVTEIIANYEECDCQKPLQEEKYYTVSGQLNNLHTTTYIGITNGKLKIWNQEVPIPSGSSAFKNQRVRITNKDIPEYLKFIAGLEDEFYDLDITSVTEDKGDLKVNSESASEKKSSGAVLTPDDFINQPEVLKSIQKLKVKFGENYEKLKVSDVLDQYGNQYVDLVQKGGGVLGVALAGYTYVLEEAGIRFLRLAGTSAGAINTALLASIDGVIDSPDGTRLHHKSGKKSKRILQYITSLNFFNLVDGHPFARWIIKNFITNKSFTKQVKQVASFILGSLLVLLFCNTLFLGLSYKYDWADTLAKITFVLTGFNILLIAAITFYSSFLFSRLRSCGYGINPGKFFYEWIKNILIENNVHTIKDLQDKMEVPIPGIRLRKAHPTGIDGLNGDVTFITSELVSQNKIEFPRMWNLFRSDPDALHPARFVRASMSIPIFFESHMIPDIDRSDPAIMEAWKEYFGVDQEDIPHIARFADGGMLSNFPVNIFYNPKVVEPRIPSFGINLDDSEPDTIDGSDAYTWSLSNYAGRIINTMRNYYDKDFMMKNKVFTKGIGNIKLSEFNWLNFFISDDDKKRMFVKGAEAACDFLLNFNWEEYQQKRIEMQQMIEQGQKKQEEKKNAFNKTSFRSFILEDEDKLDDPDLTNENLNVNV